MGKMENKRQILVVEDNSLNMKLVTDLLEFNGFEILKASDGETALKILDEASPGLIILDIQLPGINGFEVFKRIKENKKFNETKIVALTAQAMNEERENIEKAGFDNYIVKPIDIKNFIRVVKDAVHCGDIDLESEKKQEKCG